MSCEFSCCFHLCVQRVNKAAINDANIMASTTPPDFSCMSWWLAVHHRDRVTASAGGSSKAHIHVVNSVTSTTLHSGFAFRSLHDVNDGASYGCWAFMPVNSRQIGRTSTGDQSHGHRGGPETRTLHKGRSWLLLILLELPRGSGEGRTEGEGYCGARLGAHECNGDTDWGRHDCLALHT